MKVNSDMQREGKGKDREKLREMKERKDEGGEERRKATAEREGREGMSRERGCKEEE